jgi:hypothetical protein
LPASCLSHLSTSRSKRALTPSSSSCPPWHASFPSRIRGQAGVGCGRGGWTGGWAEERRKARRRLLSVMPLSSLPPSTTTHNTTHRLRLRTRVVAITRGKMVAGES